MEGIVVFHGCKWLVPMWSAEAACWQFGCCLPKDRTCPKTMKRRQASTGCFIEEYEIGYPDKYEPKED